jgi:hypothetical protein
MVMLPVTVKTKATDLDVYANGVKIGSVHDCGDCWRGTLLGRRKRRLYNRDFSSRSEAVRALVNTAGV